MLEEIDEDFLKLKDILEDDVSHWVKGVQTKYCKVYKEFQ